MPASLHASLMARLDRVPGAKEVAQAAACLGREFAYPLLAAVSPVPEAELRAAPDRLVAAELVFARGEPPEASYSFKHALVRDAAHESLLKVRRQQIHAAIVRVLEERSPETADAEPELLARHCTEAGLAEQAVSYWHKAGQRALARSAMAEAVAQLTRGLDLLAGLPTGRDRDRKELDLRVALGRAFISTKGWAAPEVAETYERARELCSEEAQHPQFLAALSGLQAHHLHRSGQVPASRSRRSCCARPNGSNTPMCEPQAIKSWASACCSTVGCPRLWRTSSRLSLSMIRPTGPPSRTWREPISVWRASVSRP